MAKWFVEDSLSSWAEFRELISAGISAGFAGVPLTRTWFRGQSDADWPLVSSFDRAMAPIDIGRRNQVATAMLEAFKERATHFADLRNLTDSQIVCLMQHYGAPTRVLDWSTSPYVAAYFGFAGLRMPEPDRLQLSEPRCAVFAINTDAAALRGGGSVSLVQSSFERNERAWAQHGRFTASNSSHENLEEELRQLFSNPVHEPTTWVLRKITIPRREASVAMKDLELMGLTSESLFAGIEGAAKYSFFRAMDEAGVLGDL